MKTIEIFKTSVKIFGSVVTAARYDCATLAVSRPVSFIRAASAMHKGAKILGAQNWLVQKSFTTHKGCPDQFLHRGAGRAWGGPEFPFIIS